MSVISTGVLSTTTLETFRSRAAGYDRENRFFQEDFDDLRQAGYLRMAVPKELGGLGFSLADVARETRSLASYAPATALGTNMHNYWVGVASELWRTGDRSCEWILREAALPWLTGSPRMLATSVARVAAMCARSVYPRSLGMKVAV